MGPFCWAPYIHGGKRGKSDKKERNIERVTRRIRKIGKMGLRWRKADGGDHSSWRFEIQQL